MFAQTATLPAGAGIQPKPKFIDKDIEKAYLKSLPRYVFSAGEPIGLGDRQIGIPSIPQGRLTLLDNYTYQIANLSDDYIMKAQGGPFVAFTKSAQDCADEVVQGLMYEGLQRVYVVNALTGKEPELAIELERVLVPDLPATLKGLATYLRTTSPLNIEKANMPDEIRVIAEAVRAELYEIAVATMNFQNKYVDRTERELINSRKPNGHGKSSLDDNDRHYYRMLARPVPKEADLEYVATQEGEEASENSALASAISKLSDKLDGDSKVKSLEAQIAALTKLVNKLVKKDASE